MLQTARFVFALISSIFIMGDAHASIMTAAFAAPTPAIPQRIAHSLTLHDKTWNDPYFWMRKLPDEAMSPELSHAIEAENQYSESYFRQTAELENALISEMRGRIERLSNPDQLADLFLVRVGTDLFYYSPEQDSIVYKNENSKPLLTFKKGFLSGRSLLRFLPSPNLDQIALLVSRTAAYPAEVWIIGLSSNHLESATSDRFAVEDPENFQWAWSTNGKTLMYVDPSTDQKKLQVVARTAGKSSSFFQSEDLRTYVVLDSTRDERYLRVQVVGYHREYPVVFDRSTLKKVWSGPVRTGMFSQIESDGEYWMVKSNLGQRFYQVYRMLKSRGTQAVLESDLYLPGGEDLDYAPDRNVEENTNGLDCFKKFCVISRKSQGKPELVIVSTDAKLESRIADQISFPEPFYFIKVTRTAAVDSDEFEIEYDSYLKSEAMYRYTLGKGLSLVSETSIPGVDYRQYKFEQIQITSHDGVKVPVTLLYNRKTELKPTTPFYVQVYGTYGSILYIDYDVTFNMAHAVSMLDRGVVFAFVHARGGGELGHHWYIDGNREKKMNTVLDFRAALEELIAKGWTSARHIVISGCSAGGIAIGNALNSFPHLFNGALIQNGFLDLVTSQMDPSIPFVRLEWEIWGNPSDRSDFKRMWAMDPYQNLSTQKYPAVFVKTSVDDTTVLVHEAVKYVSKMREKRVNSDVVTVLQVHPSGIAGHDGRYNNYELDAARNFTFILNSVR